MTAEPWAPQVVSGTGRDRRLERREREMQELWGDAWGLADEGDRGGALEVFLEANDLGMAFPTEEGRVCRLTGTVALGRARLPFTDWDVDAAISHGRDEARPTALDRFVGWVDGNGDAHTPEKVLVRTQVKGGAVVGLSRKGSEAVYPLLGLSGPESLAELKYNRRGVIELHPFSTPSGPTAVED